MSQITVLHHTQRYSHPQSLVLWRRHASSCGGGGRIRTQHLCLFYIWTWRLVETNCVPVWFLKWNRSIINWLVNPVKMNLQIFRSLINCQSHLFSVSHVNTFCFYSNKRLAFERRCPGERVTDHMIDWLVEQIIGRLTNNDNKSSRVKSLPLPDG